LVVSFLLTCLVFKTCFVFIEKERPKLNNKSAQDCDRLLVFLVLMKQPTKDHPWLVDFFLILLWTQRVKEKE